MILLGLGRSPPRSGSPSSVGRSGGSSSAPADPDALADNWETEAGDDWITEAGDFWLLE